MPSGQRIRANNVYGTIQNNPLLAAGTSFTSLGLNLLPPITTEHAVLVFDPKREFGTSPEIVVVTSHLALGTTATIVRGQYGTTARDHPQGTPWAHVPVGPDDYTAVVTSVTRPSNPYEGQLIYETDTDQTMFWNGTLWLQLGSSVLPRMGWHLTRVANQSVATGGVAAGVPISWDTEIQDTPNNFTAPGTTLTIPTGGDGLWMITFQANMGAAVDFNVAHANIVAGGFTFQNTDHDDVGALQPELMNVSALVPLVATNTIVCNVRHQAAASQNYTGRITAYRIGL